MEVSALALDLQLWITDGLQLCALAGSAFLHGLH